MDFGAPVTEIIKARCSWRSFSGIPLEQKIRDNLENFIKSLGAPLFGSRVRFALVDAGVDGARKVPGTYGVIRGAGDFIVGAVKPGAKNLEDYGYLFEKIVLFATGMDLGTCWMGGTLKHTVFAEKINLKNDEILPCICPVGIRAKQRTVTDSVFARVAGSKKRKPWSDLFFDRDFSNPLDKTEAKELATPLEMVRLAPSASNKQPWRIVKDNNCLSLFLQRNRTYKKMFKADLQRVDMGIAMCHFELAAAQENIAGKWIIKEPELGGLPPRTEYVATWVGHMGINI